MSATTDGARRDALQARLARLTDEQYELVAHLARLLWLKRHDPHVVHADLDDAIAEARQRAKEGVALQVWPFH